MLSQADLPRLGQEHIETGRYLRQIFPAYGVRVISVNDGVDTAIEQNGDDLHITLKNLLNAPYSRDISVKTRSTLLTKWQNGDYVGSYPIYGCRKARTIKTILSLTSTLPCGDPHFAGENLHRRSAAGAAGNP